LAQALFFWFRADPQPAGEMASTSAGTGLGRSASSSSIKAAGLQATHIPRRAANHGTYVSMADAARPALKPGQTHLSERQLYSSEAGAPQSTYLQAHRPTGSQYAHMGQHVAAQKYSESAAKSQRPVRNTEDAPGHRSCSHWRSEYQTNMHEDSIAGAVQHRQFGPPYQSANPATCLSATFPATTNQEGFGHYGSDPTHRMNHEDSRLPVLRADTHKGTTKGTNHIAGYSGFLPSNTVNPLVARVEQGGQTRSIEKHLMTENYNSRLVGYGGYKPTTAKNDKGGVKVGGLTSNGATFKAPNLRAFA